MGGMVETSVFVSKTNILLVSSIIIAMNLDVCTPI